MSVQSLSRVRLFATPGTAVPYPSPTPRAYSNSCSLSLGMPSNHLILGWVCGVFWAGAPHLPSLALFLCSRLDVSVWLHCVSSTGTWAQQHSLSSLSFLTLIICALFLPLVFILARVLSVLSKCSQSLSLALLIFLIPLFCFIVFWSLFRPFYLAHNF